MSQRTASRWAMVAVAAALGACGCHGPAPLDDPLRGGRPAPIAKASSAEIDEPVPLPPADAARGPAALTNASQPAPRKDPPAQASATEATARQADTFEQLQQKLQDYGVTWQMLKTSGQRGEWLFACSVPNPHEPSVERTFEAKAFGPNGLAAIRAAIAEIEAARKER